MNYDDSIVAYISHLGRKFTGQFVRRVPSKSERIAALIIALLATGAACYCLAQALNKSKT